jgi:hypothetical protein
MIAGSLLAASVIEIIGYGEQVFIRSSLSSYVWHIPLLVWMSIQMMDLLRFFGSLFYQNVWSYYFAEDQR